MAMKPATGSAVANPAEHPAFGTLKRRYVAFVSVATAGFLSWYLLYVVLSAYARDFMATRVVGHINVALLLGLGQFVTTFGIALAYERYARRQLDPLAEQIREETR